jgi:alginate O-acetyltransferase complex protein AlgI
MTSIIKNIFVFDQTNPLLFTGFSFWIFFAVTLLGYTFIYKKSVIRSAYLLLLSLFFYYKSSGYYFNLLIFSTIVDYYIGQAIYRNEKDAYRKIFVGLSVFVNLSVLIYFKYAYFFSDSISHLFNIDVEVINYLALGSNKALGTEFDISEIILPVGISFYTFQTISYSIDIYRKKLEPVRNILDFGFYVSFFPQLVAGPIVRAAEFIPQIYKKYSLTKEQFGYAVFLILNGLLKKMLVSDYISINFVDRVFDNPESYTGFENLMATYGYAIQIYCDFSGYTDIAIGIALLLGFNLPVNFNSPYKANNITDFWRRWHISLSTWLRDYLYISLGGNRKGVFRQYINLMITMVLGGLWHGANIRFIIWGTLHGVGLAVHKVWMRYVPISGNKSFIYRIITTLFTFHFVCLTWIYFRAKDIDNVYLMISKITSDINFGMIPQIILSYKNIMIIMFVAIIIHLTPTKIKIKYQQLFINSPYWVKILSCVLVAFIVYQSKSAGVQPFIYFQF